MGRLREQWEAYRREACPDGCGKDLKPVGYSSPLLRPEILKNYCNLCDNPANGDLVAHHHAESGCVPCTALPFEEWAEREFAALRTLADEMESALVEARQYHCSDGRLAKLMDLRITAYRKWKKDHELS